MIIDWFAREWGIVLAWWMLITLAAVTVFPLCLRVFSALPDKGYTLSRTVGLMLVAFVYWLLASFGFVHNSPAGMILAWLIVGGISIVVFLRGSSFSMRSYWNENRTVIVSAELLFLILFVIGVMYRAYLPDTSTTEKPMELAFISGIMRSPSFPPNDPWLAGYSISYYHFGYIQSAMLSMLSGVNSGIGFSMTIASWFALAGVTAFGVVTNLVRSNIGTDQINNDRPDTSSNSTAILIGVLASIFVLLVGNFQFPLIEIPYQSGAYSTEYMNFWGVQERVNLPESESGSSFNLLRTMQESSTWDYWWWFRASRVLTDYELDGTISPHAQPIDEFPAFSFILGDVHPHVLALPFTILALGLALNIILVGRDPNRYELVFYALMMGGLFFLNAWDGPIYLAALIGADALRRLLYNEGRLSFSSVLALVQMGMIILFVAVLAYLPFLIGFRSQASGFLPNLLYPTAFRRLFIMFGPLLLMVTPFVIFEAWQGNRKQRMNWVLGVQAAAAVFGILLFATIFLTLVGALVPSLRETVEGFVIRQGGWGVILPLLFQKRLLYSSTIIILLAGIGVVVARLFPRSSQIDDLATNPVTYTPATGFALLLVGMACSLVLVPEFIYLRDNFAVRINTIFKFYYQAWVIFSIVSAYGVYALLFSVSRPARSVRIVYGVILVSILFLGVLYPAWAAYSRAWVETGYYIHDVNNPPTLTLDGRSKMTLSYTDYEAVMCLDELVQGDSAVVAEAVQMAYRPYYARVGSITGIPIVMGWQNHERQWRGLTYYTVDDGRGADARANDINELFTDLRWDFASEIIRKHQIDYIFFGETERRQYGSSGEEKFQENLPVVCEFGTSRVYRVSNAALSSQP